MNNNYSHFLITRFNLRSQAWVENKAGEPVLNEMWMSKRMDLFKKYCFPSVLNQTNKNFKWLIFFDSNTAEKYKRQIFDLVEHNDFIYIYFINGMLEFNKRIQEAIHTLRNSSPYVISTRLDNDDLIHKNFIGTIQSLFVEVPETLIDLRRGYQLSLEGKRIELRHFYDEFTHFISLIEYGNDIKSVFSRELQNWRGKKEIIIEDTNALFIEIVHGGNLVNSIFKFQPFVFRFNPNNFGLTSADIRKLFPRTLYLNKGYYLKKSKEIFRKFFQN